MEILRYLGQVKHALWDAFHNADPAGADAADEADKAAAASEDQRLRLPVVRWIGGAITASNDDDQPGRY